MKLKLSFLILCVLGAFLLVHAGDIPSPGGKKLNAAGRIEYEDYPEALAQVVITTKQVVNDYQCIPTPGNPPSGNVRVYCDSGTGLLTCRTSAGASCAGSATTAFSAITSGTNTAAAMHVGTGATLDATGSGTITATTITGSLDTVIDGFDFVKMPFGEGPIPLISNGNFEQAGFGGSSVMPPPGWFPDSAVTASYETIAPCEGSQSLKIVYPGSAGGNEVSSLLFAPAQPGDVFYLSGIVKTDGVLTGTLRINFVDKNNAGIGVDPAATTTSTNCTSVSVTGTAPVGTVYVVVRLGYTPNATPGTVWYDAINLYKVNVPAGQSIYAGATSGSAALGVAAVAGTPNRVNLPTTTGVSGQFLKTDGGNPQQTSWGLLAQSGAVHSTGNTAAISTATLCAASAGACNVAGQYHVHWNFIETGTACGTPTPGGVTFTLTWTDTNTTVHTIQLPMDDSASLTATSGTFTFRTTLAAAWASGDINVSTNGSIIQYATGYTACGVGTGTYQLDAAVTRLQ